MPLTVSCFSKIQIGFAFLVPAHLGSPGKRAIKRVCVCVYLLSGSVAEWLSGWIQAQKGLGSNRSSDAVGNSLRQTVHTRRVSFHQAAKLLAALLRVARVTAGLAESYGSLPPGLWLTSPAGWLPRTRISSGTLHLAVEYGLPFPFLNLLSYIVRDKCYSKKLISACFYRSWKFLVIYAFILFLVTVLMALQWVSSGLQWSQCTSDTKGQFFIRSALQFVISDFHLSVLFLLEYLRTIWIMSSQFSQMLGHCCCRISFSDWQRKCSDWLLVSFKCYTSGHIDI